MQYRHLLVPVDLNDAAGPAIEAAFDLASRHHARTTLMYVIEAIDQRADEEDDDDGSDEFFAELEVGVRRRMASLLARFEQAGLAVRAEVVIGHSPREIIQFSATEAVDLVVMRSERVDLNRPFEKINSVSHQVSLLCQCPVMLIK